MFKYLVIAAASIVSLSAQAEVSCKLTQIKMTKVVQTQDFSDFQESSAFYTSTGKTTATHSTLRYVGISYDVELYQTSNGKARIDISAVSDACLSKLPCRSLVGFNSGFDGIAHLSIPEENGTVEIHCAERSN